jgi:UDP-glucose 6-dehydrogenase
VTFCNEFYDIAERFGVDYNELRELWLLDPRIGRSHTFVLPDDRGFGGKCLPKDVSAMVQTARKEGYAAGLLIAMLETNARFRAEREGSVAREPVSTLGTRPAVQDSGNGTAPVGE